MHSKLCVEVLNLDPVWILHTYQVNPGASVMSQGLMNYHNDYDGLAPHEVGLAREFHVLIVKQRIEDIRSKLDAIKKDDAHPKPVLQGHQGFLGLDFFKIISHIRAFNLFGLFANKRF